MLESVLEGEMEYVKGYAFEGKIEGEVVVALINFSFDECANVNLDLKGMNASAYAFEEYHLNGPLDSNLFYVNGQEFAYKNGQFPELKGVVGNGSVKVAPATIVWI